MMGVYNGSKCDLEYDSLCKEFCIKGGDKLIDAFQGYQKYMNIGGV